MTGRCAAWNAKYEFSPTKETQQETDMKSATFETVATLVGQEIGVSDWVEVDQDRINKFADATGDHQWIHVDVERAKKEMPGGKTIAHGYLTLSLIPWLTGGMLRVEGVTRGINYGSNKVRFTNMVTVGSRVRARQKLTAVEPRAGGMQLTNEVTIEIDGQQRPACVAETISLIYK
jgi:acyl dehydratase